ncbi:hypothetical protein KAR48_15990 [bacterium]|nr:hypothetical protein [bacterium]
MISTVYVRRTGDDPIARHMLIRFQKEGAEALTEVIMERVFRLEGITSEEAFKLKPLLSHATTEDFTSKSHLIDTDGPVFEVGYQRAVTDPELPSLLRGARALGIDNLIWARLAHRYQFIGIDSAQAQQLVERHLYNPQVQVLINANDVWDTLQPRGDAGPVETISLKGLSDDELLEFSEERRLFLSLDHMKALQTVAEKLGRELTDAEVEMFAQTWSDHCFHTTWKSLGLLEALGKATYAIDHPLVLSVFEDNAGAMEFYDGWALTIKGETHNSPTAVSPYGGVMTKHGGVIRDTLGCGQGALPIGGSTVMGLGDPGMDWKEVPHGALHPRTILTESIRGTADYCNPMGIPMMFPVYRFHPGYTGKCLALGHSIGLLPAARAPKGKPQAGDLAILAGGRTGRDGLHGATVSSASMTSDTHVVDATHVQIGHPIEERKFMEAIPVLRDADCLHAITDLGAAGLSSAGGEMGENTGIWINLAKVPLKTQGMHPWEIWISESQERMLLCVSPDKLKQAEQILDNYEVPHSVIGKFTDTMRCQIIFDPESDDAVDLPVSPQLTGQVVVDLDFETLRKGCPLPVYTLKRPDAVTEPVDIPKYKSTEEWKNAIFNVICHLNICDQSSAGYQFDKTVQGNSIVEPYGGVHGNMPNDYWAAAPLRGKPYAAVTSLGYAPLLGDVDSVQMSRLMVIESITRLVAAGVSPAEIVLCDNFYTPRINDTLAWELKEMVMACCDLSIKFGTPFISGKDSSSGTFIGTDGQRLDIPPTLAVMAMGRMPNAADLVSKPLKSAGNTLILAGPASFELGGSIFFDTLNKRGSTLPNPDPDDVLRFWTDYHDVWQSGAIQAASAISEGGILRRLFEMAMGSELGVTFDTAKLRTGAILALFAETIGTMIIEVNSDDAGPVSDALGGIIIGNVKNKPELTILTEDGNISLTIDSMVKAWERPFREVAI